MSDLITVEEAAIMLGVTIPTLWRIRKQRDWAEIKDGRRLMLNHADIQQEVDERREKLIKNIYKNAYPKR